MDELTTEVIDSPPPAVEAPESADAGNAPVAEQGESNAPQTAEQTTAEQPTKEAEAPFHVPENDDDLKDQINNPHVQSIVQLRQELRERNQRLDGYKPLESWKPVAETIGDPALAQSAHELVSAIHTPDPNNPSGFTARPFLERMEQDSPGSVDQIFSDTLTLQIQDAQGRPSTVVRELVKSWGIDPDRFDDYRNIDTLRASGIVTADDLDAIPEKFHAAFRALSTAQREDILAQRPTDANGTKSAYPAAALDYLQDKAEALEARQWREKDETAKRAAQEQAQAKFEADVTLAVDQDIVTEIQAISDSVHQNLTSQFTFSSDAAVNALEHTKILSVLGNLQSPYPVYRDLAVKALKAVGVEPNGFEELANRLAERREAYVRFNAIGDKMQATRALSEATFAKQHILAKVNDYASRLAKASGERAAASASQQDATLAAAQGRFVPAGNGQAQQGFQNPYSQNSHPVGSQEYYAFNRKVDKEYNLTNASVFS